MPATKKATPRTTKTSGAAAATPTARAAASFPPVLMHLVEEGLKTGGKLDAEHVAAVISRLRASGEQLTDEDSDRFYAYLAEREIVLIEPEEEDDELSESELEEVELAFEAEADLMTTDGTRLYFNEIRRHPLLTPQQEVELARKKDWYLDETLPIHKRQEGKRAFDQMMRSNLRLVVSIAKRYQNSSGMPLMDLCQEGNLGLHRAIEKFDWRKGFKLSTYATWWIRQAITRAIAEQGRTIRIPVHKNEALNRFRRARARLEAQHGREPTKEELAAWLGISVEEVAELEVLSVDPVSLNTRIGDGEQTELGDLVADDNAAHPELLAMRSEPSRIVEQALELLPVKHRKVVMLRYGIGTDEPTRTLEEIADKLGTTREAIRQIDAEAMEILRQRLELESLRDLLVDD
jgi:RNA polymerase primary sigma factor